MKILIRIPVVLFLLLILVKSQAQNVGIGTTTPDISAILEIKSSAAGLLIPRTSTTSRLAIANPAKGLMVYDTTNRSFWYYRDTSWAKMTATLLEAPIPVLGDFDGDAKADLCVYYPSQNKWTYRRSSNGVVVSYTFAAAYTGWVPVPQDYDGDNKTDMALYDSQTKGWVYISSANGALVTFTF